MKPFLLRFIMLFLVTILVSNSNANEKYFFTSFVEIQAVENPWISDKNEDFTILNAEALNSTNEYKIILTNLVGNIEFEKKVSSTDPRDWYIPRSFRDKKKGIFLYQLEETNDNKKTYSKVKRLEIHNRK